MSENNDAQILTVALGEELFGIEVLSVQEIRGFTRLTPIPEADSGLKGLMNLRGTVIPVMDLRLRLGLEARDYDKFTLVVVVNVTDKLVGLVVDAVSAVKCIPGSHISPAPPSTTVRPSLLSGVAKLGEDLVLMLDLELVVQGVAEQVSNDTEHTDGPKDSQESGQQGEVAA